MVSQVSLEVAVANRTFMRGKLSLRLEHMDELRPRFLWEKSWSDVTHPDITSCLGFTLLTHAGPKGNFVPGGLDDRPPRGWGFEPMRIQDNRVSFIMGFKDDLKLQQAFVSLLPVIAYEWELEQDWTETTTAFFNEDDPEFGKNSITRWDSKVSRSVDNAEEVVEQMLSQIAMITMNFELGERVDKAIEARQRNRLNALGD